MSRDHPMDLARPDHHTADPEHAVPGAATPTCAPSPGSPAAERRGCVCSVLLNRHTPDEAGDAPGGFVDPLCPVHGTERPSTS